MRLVEAEKQWMRVRPRRPDAVAMGALVVLVACGNHACGNHERARPLAPAPAPIASATAPEPSLSPEAASASASAFAPSPALAAPPAPPPGIRQIGRCDNPSGPQRFTIAHFNDLQARYSDRIAGKSRYAYLAGYLRQVKQDTPNTLVLDAGDDYEKGSLADLRSNGEVTRQIVQALPIDARTIGNHDFAYGESAVLRDVALSGHPVLAANVRRGENKGPFVPYVRIDVGCVKVGIVGLTTQGYGGNDEQTKEPFFGVLHHDDRYYQLLDEQIRAHRREVDVMIALTHLGQYFDSDLAKAHAGIDFFVGGHSEDLLSDLDGTRRKDKTHAYVMQVGRNAKYVGRADVVVHPSALGPPKGIALERYTITTIDEKLPAAADVADLVTRLEREAVPDLLATIANVASAVDAKAMGELVRRAVVDRWGADALVLGSDVFFDGLPAGPLSLQRLYDTVFVQKEPAGTTGFTSLYAVMLSGEDLKTLKQRARPPYVVYLPDAMQATKSYKVLVEKRALGFPSLAFNAAPKAWPASGRFAGELIDALEAYARARAAKGQSL